MRLFTPLFLLGSLLTYISYSQSPQPATDYPSLYHRAEKLFNASNASAVTDSTALSLYLQASRILVKKNIYNDILVDCWLKCGILLMTGRDQAKAMNYFHQVIDLKKSNQNLPDSLFFKPCLYAGSIQYELNNLDSAEYYYKKAEAIYSENTGLTGSERLFNKLGALYFETGDYNKSISYFEKALALVQDNSPSNLFFVITYKNNIATTLMKLGRFDQALKIFRELLAYGNPADELLFNIGNTYFEKSEYHEAIRYLRQVRHLGFDKIGSLIKIFIHLHQYDSAKHYLSEANRLLTSNSKLNSTVTHGMILKFSGDLKAATGKPLEALKDYQSAIISLDPSFKDESPSANPTTFSGLQNFSFLFDALIAKANLLKSMEGSGNRYLEQSIPAYASAFALASHVEKMYFSDDARLFLKNRVNPATQEGVGAAIRLYDKTKDEHYKNVAFNFIESNKASVLQAGLKNLELSAIPGLPISLIAQEKRYKTQLAKLEIESAGMQRNLLSTNELDLKIHDLEISLASIQDKLDENPVYHALKFSGSSVDLENVRKGLQGSDEAILSYYYTGSNLICFYVTKEDVGFMSMPLKETLFADIVSLRRELLMPEASGGKYLREMGISLFKNLLGSVFQKIENKKHLIIIPFNEISYVPFEMLVNPDDASLLVKNFYISYNYSASSLSDNRNATVGKYIVLAMAPFSEKSEILNMSALPASLEEIEQLPGKKLLGPQATKSQFEYFSGQFPVIHLATHAVANDSNLLGSYIAFYGLKNEADELHRLYEQEIYTIDLKSVRLVILSACETGNGVLVNGEGVMSLSRAFSYAGCKSVITSLWKADELSTSFIAKHLHHYLQKGLSIDESLQKAKIDYLETNEVEERYKNPAYWAHLILIGNFESVVKPTNNWWLETILIVVFIFIAYGLIKKTRHRNMPGWFYRIYITDEG
jgi:CHAT domain-containing protein/Tfp pilus assembly protein PilF